MGLETARLASEWWRDMQPMLPEGKPNRRADRAALARLRRADLHSALDDPATFDLFRKLGCTEAKQLTVVAICAAVLATVREDDFAHPARALGPATSSEETSAAMSVLRFRRLIEASEPEERLISLRRAVMLGKRKLRVHDLARACLDWSDNVRREWIFQYYNAASAIPDMPNQPSDPQPATPSEEPTQ